MGVVGSGPKCHGTEDEKLHICQRDRILSVQECSKNEGTNQNLANTEKEASELKS